MAPPDLDRPPAVRALLGPTNTGKTWRAIRRMLAHRTGQIGLPLRLLAREVYDRCSAEVGEDAVALVTGEEKRIPTKPRYWVCTTESMPVERPVDFLAVDEIQLVAHRERGHVFTERLQRARGFRETWFLGSDSAAPVVSELVPTAEFEGAQRLSRLSWAGCRPLASLPRRSAVIAFSMNEVYTLAEAIRRKHGGAAVVMGALSPRTRNAQVALYQSGEVPYLVATDAIGMGLNMDIDHVAFASTRKFDGQGVRPLEVSELAQIAGRAGRYRRDGTFGTLDGVGELPPEVVAAIESHRFPALKTAFWRNPELDFSSLDALQDSLRLRPPTSRLRPVPRAEDSAALLRLAERPEVRARATGRENVALLWEICRIPDFGQTLTDHHIELLAELWHQLTGRRQRLDPDWLHQEIGPLDQPDGDLEILLTRIAHIRTWTTVAFHAAWIDDAPSWQARVRDIEDRLSDALHERLTQRFVDRRTLALGSSLANGRSGEVASDGTLAAAGHALGTLRGITFEPTDPNDKTGWKATKLALAETLAERVEALVAAPHEAISLDADGTLCWEGGRLARWVAGEDLLAPAVRLDDLPLLGPGARSRVHRRLLAWTRDAVARFLEPLRRPGVHALSAPARGLLWELERALGTVPRAAVADRLNAISEMDRRALATLDVRVGTEFVYVASLLQGPALALRGLLWSVSTGRPAPPLPPPGAPSLPASGDPAAFLALGYPVAGARAVRVDLLERVLARLRGAAREGPFEVPAEITHWLGVPRAELPAVVTALGYPRRPDGRHGRRGSRI